MQTTLIVLLVDNALTSVIVKDNAELSKLSLWFRVNRLSLNVKKTNFILFRTMNKHMTQNVKIHIDGVDMSRVTTTKFVGVIINETLTWNDHMKLIYSNISKSIEIIQRVSYNLSTSVLLSLYYTMVRPYYVAISFELMSNRNILRNCQHLSAKSCV